MVKKIVVFFAYFVFFISMLLYFMPKVNLYYLLESQLKKEDVIVSNETLRERGFTLHISDADISLKSISTAIVTSTDINFFILYNKISLQDIQLSSTAKSFVPLHIDSIDVIYSFFNPLKINIYAKGEFGYLEGFFSLSSMNLHLRLKPSKIMIQNNSNTLRSFKKEKNGEFSYDKSF